MLSASCQHTDAHAHTADGSCMNAQSRGSALGCLLSDKQPMYIEVTALPLYLKAQMLKPQERLVGCLGVAAHKADRSAAIVLWEAARESLAKRKHAC